MTKTIEYSTILKRREENKFSITRAELTHKIKTFLRRGGKIKKLPPGANGDGLTRVTYMSPRFEMSQAPFDAWSSS